MMGFKLSKGGKLFFAIYIIGTLFKIQHWPFAEEIVVVSVFMVIIFQLLDLWKSKSKTIVIYLNALVVIALSITWTLKILHWPYQFPFLIVGGIGLISLIIIDSFFPSLSDDQGIEKKTLPFFLGTNKLYLIGAPFIIFGACFKILHWPFSSVLLITGLIISGLSFFIEFFRK